jgi:hypothetical protein
MCVTALISELIISYVLQCDELTMGIRPMDWESWIEVRTLPQLAPVYFTNPSLSTQMGDLA